MLPRFSCGSRTSGIIPDPGTLCSSGEIRIRGLQLCQPVADALTFVLGVVIVLGILRELKEKQEQAE